MIPSLAEFAPEMTKWQTISPEKRELFSKFPLSILKSDLIPENWRPSEETMSSLFENGYLLYQGDKFDEAFNFFSTLMRFDPTSYRYTFGTAAAQHKIGHFSAAVGLYQWCAPLNPPLPDLHFYMYDCFLKLGEREAAEQELDTVLQLTEGRKEYAPMHEKASILKGTQVS